MRQALCLALAKHAGETLTQEVARLIIADLFPDRSIDVTQWAPQTVGRYTLQAERFAATDELAEIHALFHAEIDRTGEPLDFDHERMAEIARAGCLVQFTARAGPELAGVMRLFVDLSVLTKQPFVKDSLFYVKREHRGQIAAQLWRYAERSMFAYGAREVSFTAHGKVASMARYMGYQPVATKFSKTHQGDDYAQVTTRHQEKPT